MTGTWEEAAIQSDDGLADARRRYAEELRYYAHVRFEAVVSAFASVPREAFLGPGPWSILDYDTSGYWATEDADPRHLYHNVLVAIDRERGLNNGQPGFWAYLLDRLEIQPGERVLHIGAGVGYYSAIQAEIVGASGRVTAIEVDPALAARARANLADRPNVEVIAGDGLAYRADRADVIIVNAGVTHPQGHWLDSLPEGGRLLLPLTLPEAGGGYLRVTRFEAGFAARFISRVGIYPATNGRDPQAEERLRQAFEKAGYGTARELVNSLRRDLHEEDGDCWLHAPEFCLSKKGPIGRGPAGIGRLRGVRLEPAFIPWEQGAMTVFPTYLHHGVQAGTVGPRNPAGVLGAPAEAVTASRPGFSPPWWVRSALLTKSKKYCGITVCRFAKCVLRRDGLRQLGSCKERRKVGVLRSFIRNIRGVTS